MNTLTVSIAALVLAGFGFLLWRFRKKARPVPDAIISGKQLPEFSAVDEHGRQVSSNDLAGSPAVLLFVRGNWCPFCSSQVRNLTDQYKAITDLGARLILVTPKPLDTTRRVAEFFEVDFDFWLDEDFSVARQLGLFLPSGVPSSHRQEYGEDTIWPASLVVDAAGVIRYTEVSKMIVDRPKAATLLQELKKTLAT